MCIPFRSVNRRLSAVYKDGYQKHHVFPLKCADSPIIARLLNEVAAFGFSLNTFKLNGMLLPSNEATALESGLPLHLGGHPAHSQFVIDQMLQIAAWTPQMDARVRQRRSFFQLTALSQLVRQSIQTNRNSGGCIR